MRRGLVAAVVVAVWCAGPWAQGQQFPNVKQRGRAIVEYKDPQVHVVAGYEYSQRHHDSPWLLIDVAASSSHALTLHRNDVKLTNPDGSELMVASQRRVVEDTARIRSVLQNAKVWRRDLDTYFSERGTREPFRFFALPGDGIVHDSVIMKNDRVSLGALFFESPTGRWPAGTYRLQLDHERARAALPIVLD